MTQPSDIVADDFVHDAFAWSREGVKHLLHRDALLVADLLLQRLCVLLPHIGHSDQESIFLVVLYAVLLGHCHGFPAAWKCTLGSMSFRIIFDQFDLSVIAVGGYEVVAIAPTEERVDLVLRHLA